MKKLMILILTLFIIVSQCGCRRLSDDASGDTFFENTASSGSYTTDCKDDNTVSSKDIVSTDSSSNQTSVENSNKTSLTNSQNSNITKKQTNYNSSEWHTSPQHEHKFTESVIKEAGIGVEGVVEYTCICGYSFTDSIPAKSSLTIPSLPKSFSSFNKETIEVTNITYKFDNYGLELYYSGTKTYDSEGPGHSNYCYIGWKLYGPDGSVVKSGYLDTPSVAVGDSFNNKEVAIDEYDHLRPGAYRLELFDVG